MSGGERESSPPSGESVVPLSIPGLAQPLRLQVHGEHDRHVSRRLREEGVWEPFETAILMRLLRPGDVFVDVGANIGYFSVIAASVVGDGGAVHAFEPEPENFRLLRRNAGLNGLAHRITAVQAALSDTSGEGRLFLSGDNLGDHQLYAGEESRRSVPVRLCAGSDYFGAGPGRLDLLKIDTQGTEYHVLAGLLPLLRQLDRAPRIIVELTPHALRQAGASGRALVTLLASLGLPLWIIDHTEHRLAATGAEELATWCDNWDAVPEARGFMNILAGDLDPDGLAA